MADSNSREGCAKKKQRKVRKTNTRKIAPKPAETLIRAQYDAQLEDRFAESVPRQMCTECPRESDYWYGTGAYVGDGDDDWD